MSGGWEYAGAACLSGSTGSLCKSYDPLYPDSRNPYPGKRLNIIDELAECDFGEFENKNYQELDEMNITSPGSILVDYCHFREERADEELKDANVTGSRKL